MIANVSFNFSKKAGQNMSEAKFKVISDSCCDLPKEIVEAEGIDIVPLYVAFQDGVYSRDYYDFTYHDFYQKMVDRPGDFPKTSLPSVEDYMKAWEPYVKEGMPVLSISMTSKMSGSYNSARMAKDVILDTYPDAEIEVIDSLGLTILEGMLVREACALRRAGKTLAEAAQIINQVKAKGRAFFTVKDLSYLSKGGRIGSLVKFAAVGLGIKPVIRFQDGGISLSAITRSQQRSLRELAHQVALYFTNEGENPADYYVEVGYGLHREQGVELRELLSEELKKAGFTAELTLRQIGTMVGAHNGPMLMGIAFLKKLACGTA